MKRIIILSLVIIIFSSCSKNLVPYSYDLVEKNSWDKNQIEQIQFYTSGDILLKAQEGSRESEINSGTIELKEDKAVEEIFIKKGTPGVVVYYPSEKKYGISFETDDKYLSFGANPNRNNVFYLLASDWNKKVGKITYQGKKYYAAPSSANVYLMVNLKKVKKLSVEKRVAKGRKVH